MTPRIKSENTENTETVDKEPDSAPTVEDRLAKLESFVGLDRVDYVVPTKEGDQE